MTAAGTPPQRSSRISESSQNVSIQSSVRRSRPGLAFGSWAFSFGPFAASPWPFDRLCAYAADAGYDGVEINGFRPHPHHDDFNSDERCRELRRVMHDAGVVPAGYAPDFAQLPPAQVAAADYLGALDAARAFCERMEISTLRVDTVSPPGVLAPDEYQRRWDRLVATWHEAARRCQSSGVTLVWEFEPGFWLNRPTEVRDLVQAVDHPAFRVLFDTCHAYTGAVAGSRQGPEPQLLAGGVIEYAEMLAPYLGHLHLIDSDGSLHDEQTSEHLPFGSGSVDFGGVLQALEPALSELEWWGIDFCFCPTTTADARRAVPFVRALAAAHEASQASVRCAEPSPPARVRTGAGEATGRRHGQDLAGEPASEPTSEPIELAYSERGAGDPLVLIMGLGADRTAWDLHVGAYEKRFRCFAVDNRGVGASAKPPGPYSTAQMADDYARLISRLTLGPVRIVGISMGGAIAQELAIRHPSLVRKLVLVSTWGRCDAYTSEVFAHFARVRAAVSPPDFTALLQLWIWTRRYLDEHLPELIEARYAGPDTPQPAHAFEAQCEACISHDTIGRLPAILVPTLITVGDADIFTPLALTEELHAQIPGAALHVFAGAGHAHHWEALENFNRLTGDWLA